MALARIITRSQQCSRELALDLLARGYAVEIVSPDAVPDNIADLELRVDTAPGDQLIASVEAHDGAHSSSLDFVHHLKSPMVDFIRRPPDLGPLPSDQFADLPEQRILFKVEHNVEYVVAPPKARELPPMAAPTAAPIVHDAELVRAENTRPIAPLIPLPQPPPEPPRYLAIEDQPAARSTTIPSKTIRRTVIPSKTITPATPHPPLVVPGRTYPRRARSAPWRWRAALVFASVVLLAVVLGFGMHRIGRAAQDSEQSSEPISGPSFSQASVVSLPPPGVSAEANFARPPRPSEIAKPKPLAPIATPRPTPRARNAHRHTDDVIARDTVTYLDDRYRPASQPKPANRVASRQPKSPKHSKAVIAASSVTYLKKPKSKTTK